MDAPEPDWAGFVPPPDDALGDVETPDPACAVLVLPVVDVLGGVVAPDPAWAGFVTPPVGALGGVETPDAACAVLVLPVVDVLGGVSAFATLGGALLGAELPGVFGCGVAWATLVLPTDGAFGVEEAAGTRFPLLSTENL